MRRVRSGVAAASACVLLALGSAQAHGPADNAAGTFEIDWGRPQIQRTIAVGVFNSFGLRVDNDSSRARRVEREGQAVVEGIALAFDVEDSFGFDFDETITAVIELDVTNLSEFYYAWDRNGTTVSLARQEIGDDRNGWQRFRLSLPRARFANRGFGGTDFAISGGIDASSRLLSIRSLRFERTGSTPAHRTTGTLELIVKDAESGESVAAQVGLYDESGRMPLPSGLAVPLDLFETRVRHVEVREELDHLSWPHRNHYSMYVDGFYRAQVPAGHYDLVVSKGPEYPIVRREIVVEPDQPARIDVELRHVLDMQARGWYSGDVHNHLGRRNQSDDPYQMAHARAQDLHMHWLYALGNSAARHFEQYAWGRAGQYREADYWLGSGQEDPRTDVLGHVLAMGHSEWVRDPNDYLRYDRVARRVHELGGIFGIAHMDFPQFQQGVALALLAPLGEIDFVEVLQYHALAARDWYAFLNLGFRLPAAAGSDWPYMSLPGSVRTYVQTQGDFTPEAWNEGLRAGRSFASNGPMLDFRVNGQGIGSVIEARAGQQLSVHAEAAIEPTWDRLTRLELVANGEVIHAVEHTGAERLVLEHAVPADRGMWLAVRALGSKSQEIVFQAPYTKRVQAHSSPVYVHVDGEPSWNRVKGPAIVDAVIARLEGFRTAAGGINDNEAWESPARTAEILELQRPELIQQVEEAILFYKARREEMIRWGSE